MADRKHAELIRAWAGGADIEYKTDSGDWRGIDLPNWYEAVEYRIKPTTPAKQYPVTAMTTGDINKAYGELVCGTDVKLSSDTIERLNTFADIVLRHAIDNGQVAPLDAYQQCAKDLLKAEETIRKLNEQFVRDVSFDLRLKQRQRDITVMHATRELMRWPRTFDIDDVIALIGK